MHAVILAGGRGTRLRPLTDRRPKPLIPLGGRPFAAGLLQRLVTAGCDGATFLVGRDAEPFAPLTELGASLGIPVAVAVEPEPLDTAGAARDLVQSRAGNGSAEPVLVCNGDILTDLDYADLLRTHREAAAVATIALTHVEDTSSFGVVVCDDHGAVQRFVEKPAPGTETADTVNAGTYVLEPSAFDGCPTSGPLSFERAVFPGLLARGAPLQGLASHAFWQDLGTLERYLVGHEAVLSGRCAWALAEWDRPAPGVLVHPDATVDPAAVLDAPTAVGPGSMVAAGATLRGVAVFSDVSIGANATVTAAVVDDRASVPANAVVGPNAVVQ